MGAQCCSERSGHRASGGGGVFFGGIPQPRAPLRWNNAREIVKCLRWKFRDTDPTTLSLTMVHDRVISLRRFQGDPRKYRIDRLERIRHVWVEQYQASLAGTLPDECDPGDEPFDGLPKMFASEHPKGNGHRFAGTLQHVFGDVKRPLAGLGGESIDEGNCEPIVKGLKEALGCNGVRVYIDPKTANAATYPAVYAKFMKQARAMGLTVYANPLGTGRFGLGETRTVQEYGQWIADYANYWKPDFLGPFNESAMKPDEYLAIVKVVRSKLRCKAKLVGPDMQHTDKSIKLIEKNPEFLKAFDVITTHNADGDVEAHCDTYSRLAQLARAGVWSSENPRPWTCFAETHGREIGIKSCVEASNSVNGLVIYLAFNKHIDKKGNLTKKGNLVAQSLCVPPEVEEEEEEDAA
mmetsp:Transcript_112110/g.316837  ORF Transcript_112110/g.316837 Transcript_112110/m.316837 type:complete len:408 (+) Transcript_112110:98-1321(+)